MTIKLGHSSQNCCSLKNGVFRSTMDELKLRANKCYQNLCSEDGLNKVSFKMVERWAETFPTVAGKWNKDFKEYTEAVLPDAVVSLEDTKAKFLISEMPFSSSIGCKCIDKNEYFIPEEAANCTCPNYTEFKEANLNGIKYKEKENKVRVEVPILGKADKIKRKFFLMSRRITFPNKKYEDIQKWAADFLTGCSLHHFEEDCDCTCSCALEPDLKREFTCQAADAAGKYNFAKSRICPCLYCKMTMITRGPDPLDEAGYSSG